MSRNRKKDAANWMMIFIVRVCPGRPCVSMIDSRLTDDNKEGRNHDIVICQRLVPPEESVLGVAMSALTLSYPIVCLEIIWTKIVQGLRVCGVMSAGKIYGHENGGV